MKRIIILGGGFAGVYTAQYLESKLRSVKDVEIVLVNQENYFVFQPMLAEVVSGNIGLTDMVNPIRRLLKRTHLYVREIESVDFAKQQVRLSPGIRPKEEVLSYDHLVVSLGSVTDFRGIPGLHEHALPFKTLADAVALRNHLLHALEEASVEQDPQQRAKLLTFVVAGGGFSGVEVVAEMNDFLRRVARDYREIDPSEIRVILVHSHDRVLNREMSESLSRYATQALERKGVELRLGRRLKTASPQVAVLDNGERIATRTLVSTVPSSPNPLVDAMDVPKQHGRIQVDAHLAVADRDNLWALGDCASVPMPPDGVCPPTAQHAIRQAKVAAHNIAARIRGGSEIEFNFQGLGTMGSLGHHSAVAELFHRIRIAGFPAWLMWRTVYWWKLPGLGRKIRVGIDWALDLVLPPDIVRLQLAGSAGLTHAHFEPGEAIVQQGDVGDALYIILKGEADVEVRDDPVSEESASTPTGQSGARQSGTGQSDKAPTVEGPRVVARLGPGDFFGEQALLNNRERAATIRSASPIDVLALRKSEFSTLAANLPTLRNRFETVMEQRMKALADAKADDAENLGGENQGAENG